MHIFRQDPTIPLKTVDVNTGTYSNFRNEHSTGRAWYKEALRMRATQRHKLRPMV